MPLYEYGCKACGHRFEIQQKLAEAPLALCPSCQKEDLEKIISAAAFVLKGGGWYKDGYTGGAKKERTESQVGDSLTKAIEKDKTKTAAGGESASTPSAPASSSSDSSGGGDKSAGAAPHA